MSTVTKSAALSLTALFSTVSTAANTLNTSLNAINNFSEELSKRSAERLHNVTEDLKHDRIKTDTLRRKNAALELSRELHATEVELAKSPELTKHFNEALKLFAVLDAPAA